MLLQIIEQLLLRKTLESKRNRLTVQLVTNKEHFRGALTHHFSATPKFSMIPCRYIIKESGQFYGTSQQ